MWSRRNLGWAQAALLFGVCGAASSRLVNPEGGGTWAEWGFYLFPIPFGVVAAWLYVGRIVPGIALVILDAAVWQLAYRVAVYRPPISMVVTPAPGICLGLDWRLGSEPGDGAVQTSGAWNAQRGTWRAHRHRLQPTFYLVGDCRRPGADPRAGVLDAVLCNLAGGSGGLPVAGFWSGTRDSAAGRPIGTHGPRVNRPGW